MRVARHNTPHVTYHLNWRFESPWTLGDEVERATYLDMLDRALVHSDWRVTAYALERDRIQLAAVAGDEPLARWTKRVHTPFVRFMQVRHGRIGPMMADRSKQYAAHGDGEAVLLAYIHACPVRGWTSYRYYAGLVSPPPWLHVELGRQRAGMPAGVKLDDWLATIDTSSCPAALTERRRARRKRIKPSEPIGLVGKSYANDGPPPRDSGPITFDSKRAAG